MTKLTEMTLIRFAAPDGVLPVFGAPVCWSPTYLAYWLWARWRIHGFFDWRNRRSVWFLRRLPKGRGWV